jgi:hypothetical protein
MSLSISFVFNVIGVVFEVVAIGWAARMVSYSFKKWDSEHKKHEARSDEQHFREEKKQAIIILFISLGVLFQGVAGFL